MTSVNINIVKFMHVDWSDMLCGAISKVKTSSKFDFIVVRQANL